MATTRNINKLEFKSVYSVSSSSAQGLICLSLLNTPFCKKCCQFDAHRLQPSRISPNMRDSFESFYLLKDMLNFYSSSRQGCVELCSSSSLYLLHSKCIRLGQIGVSSTPPSGQAWSANSLTSDGISRARPGPIGCIYLNEVASCMLPKKPACTKRIWSSLSMIV